jgi:putative transposase
MEPEIMDEICRATNGNFALGSERFAARVAEVIGRRAIPGQSGRPRKSVEPQLGDLFLE